MLQNNNIGTREFNEIIVKLGMSEKDVNDIFMSNPSKKEQAYLSAGPDPYGGGYYGTISIKDF